MLLGHARTAPGQRGEAGGLGAHQRRTRKLALLWGEQIDTSKLASLVRKKTSYFIMILNYYDYGLKIN